jgi:hypothetical protein
VSISKHYYSGDAVCRDDEELATFEKEYADFCWSLWRYETQSSKVLRMVLTMGSSVRIVLLAGAAFWVGRGLSWSIGVIDDARSDTVL